MSNWLMGELSRRGDLAITLCCAFRRPAETAFLAAEDSRHSAQRGQTEKRRFLTVALVLLRCVG
jgi:hypothetical protein